MSEAYTSATQRMMPERIEEDAVQQPADCALVQDLLPLYMDNEVSPESHDRIATHIAQCERCAGYLAGTRSVRAQLLRNQQAVRTPGPAVPTVTHAPVGSAGTPAPQSITTTASPPVGRWFSIAAGVIGALILAPVFGPIAIAAAFPIGLFIIGREVWRNLRGQSSPALSLPAGSASAMLAAIVSVVGVLVCAGLIFSGLVVFTEVNDPAALLAGIFMLLFGTSGLIIINQRRGWLPQYASPAAVQQIFFMLLSGGVLAAAVIVLGISEGAPLLLGFAVVAFVFFSLFRERSAKP